MLLKYHFIFKKKLWLQKGRFFPFIGMGCDEMAYLLYFKGGNAEHIWKCCLLG